MEQQLETLNAEFSIVKENIHAITNNLATVKKKLDRLKQIYSDMISTNSNKKIFLFCLESFNFQIKSFSVDTDNLHKSLLLVSNRVYCDYYKLLKLIRATFEEYKYAFPKDLADLPTYDVLNPMFEYSVDDITKIHANVCLLIYVLIEYYDNNCDNIESYNVKSQTGICIFNFIKTLEYDNSVLKDQIVLYLNYLDFFKTTQTKHLVKLLGKMDALQKEISSEIADEPEPEESSSESSSDSSSHSSNTPVISPSNSCVNIHTNTPVISPSVSVNSIKNEFEDFVPPFARRNTNTMSETSDLTETSDISELSKDTIKTSSTEKKNEKIAPENVEEKPAKKKGRPRTKGVVETKSVKKIEENEVKWCSAQDSSKGCAAQDSSNTVEDSSKGCAVKDSSDTFCESSKGCAVKDSSDTVEDSSDNFGITIDQLQEHLNNAISMSIVENTL